MTDYLTLEEVRGIVLMILITHGATEWIKRLARDYDWLISQWSPRSLALVVGFASAYAVWPPESTLAQWQAGLAMGFGWPAVYWIVVAALRTKWPDAADKISGRRDSR